jgi:hypothetical protein
MSVQTLMPDLKDRYGSAREALKDHLDENHKDLATLYGEMTDDEKKVGRLIGRLLQKGIGNGQIDDAFTWWEQEHNDGTALSWERKNVVLLETIGTLIQIAGEPGYRTLRKVLINLNQK